MLTARSEEADVVRALAPRRRRLLEQAIQPEDPDCARQGAAAAGRRGRRTTPLTVGSLSLDVPELLLQGLCARARAAYVLLQARFLQLLVRACGPYCIY